MPSVAAVIVTYNNPAMLRDLLGDLYLQSRAVDDIVVIDNGNPTGTEREVKMTHSRVRYARMPENVGSAGGYREGIRIASATADLVWTLDDDVRLEPDSLARLLEGLEALRATAQVGAVRCVGEGHRATQPTELALVPWRGTLFSVEAIRQVGLPDGEFFLYGEDLEYSLRLRRLGYKFFWIPTSRCVERRHEKVSFAILGRWGEVSGSPFRLYYAFRNEVAIYLRHRCFLRLLHTVLYSLKVAVHFALCEGAGSRAKISAIGRGIRDGFQHKLGRRSEYVP